MKPRVWQFRAHLFVAALALVVSMGASAAHLTVLALINAALFGANITMAYLVKR